jgi:hypothetical protein
MNDSKITLDAQQTGKTVLWRRPNHYPMSYEGAYTKAQQRQNRRNNKTSQAQARRGARTHLLCEIGGLWLKYFPESQQIDPYNEAEIAAVARAMAILANDPHFARLWMKITAEMELGQQDDPAGPLS